MSGFWSFRESRSAAAAAVEAVDGAHGSELAVTTVLPTGVEYRQTLTGQTAEDTREHHKSRRVLQSKTVDWGRTSSHYGTPKTRPQLSRVLCQGTASATGDDTVAAREHHISADQVDRDQLVDAVQRQWWETLNVDIRPVSLLPTAPTRPPTQQAADTETRRVVHELLAHACGPTTEGNTAFAGGRVVQAVTARRGSGKRVPLSFCEPAARGTEPAVRGRVVRVADTRRCCSGAQQASATPTIRGAPHRGEQDAAPVRCPGAAWDAERGGGVHQSGSVVLSTGITAPHASAAPRSQCSVAHEVDLAVSVSCPIEPEGSALWANTHPQAVPHEPASGGGVASNAAAHMDAVCRREELILLRRFFAVWLSAGEQRRVQRCAASYHCFLMQCVSEALGSNAP
ncbi:hypothetical protein NESM_000049400 [Novymonas esmeraldas]|uniref:Uncharacterized protein n=1 Tax=Novymonas esmeraldas TaxID=1808958 RepID=A0AAW0F312_9TRYP